MNIVNDILVNTLFPDTDFVQTLSMNSVVPKYVENQEKGNPSVCKNCAEAPFKDLHIYGRSEQMRTTGAQLFTSAVIKGENSGVTLTRKDSVWHLEGTNIADGIRNIRFMEPTEHFKLPAGTYTLSFSKNGVFPIGINISISKVANPDISSEQIWTGIGNAGLNMPTKFTLDGTEEALSMFVNFPAGEFISCDLYVMLNAGDTALPWEPYTGGKPSPSPDYPQEIVSAGEDGNLNVTVRGKNLISPNIEWGKAGWDGTVKNTEGVVIANAVNGWGVFAFHSPAVGKTVTLSITYRQIETTSDDTTDAFAVVTLPSINYPKSDVLYTTRSPKTEESKINVTFTSDEYIGVLIRVSKENAGLMRKVELRDIQLEESSKPTAYEPYYEPQSMSVTTPNGLPGIPVASGGNYTDENGQQWICDEVDFGRGVYVQRIASFVINAKNANDISVTNLYTHVTVAVNARISTPEETSNSLETRSNRNLFCEALPWIAYEWSSTVNSMGFVENGTVDFTVENSYLGLSEASTNDERKAALVKYFTDKPCQIVYRIATPIETPLTAAEIAAYKSLRTYRGTTIVEAEDKAGISVKYNMPMPKLSKNGALRRWFKRHPII